MSEDIASIHDLCNPNVDYAKQVDPLTDMIVATVTFHFSELIWSAEDDELYSSNEEESPNTPFNTVWTWEGRNLLLPLNESDEGNEGDIEDNNMSTQVQHF